MVTKFKLMKITNFKNRLQNTKFYLIMLGIASTVWFLFRVIPKPSRASYPCMRVAAPFMSTLVIYLLSLGTTTFAFKRFHKNIKNANYLTASLFLVVGVLSFSAYLIQDSTEAIARSVVGIDETFPIASNEPIGEAKGLYPGRVVWAHNPDVVDQTYDVDNAGSHPWYSNQRVDQGIAIQMLNQAIREYAEADNSAEAWDKIFKSFNNSAGRGDVGYKAGEKIAVKINLTNQCCADATRMDATPQLVNALIYELTANAGVRAADITLGDPYREFRSEYQDIVKGTYPDVVYVDGYSGNGSSQTLPSSEKVLVFSDGQYESTLPQHYLDATYFINMPCLKTHNEGGITLIAKNHQGSFLGANQAPENQYAIDMHYSLPKNSSGTGKYRHTVDYMGHEETGGKGLLYIIDGIWAGEGWEGYIKKYKSAPFNDAYPASVFVGQDPVALESVGFDILFQEYVVDASKEPYPIIYKDEIADYLKQCASSDYWPSDIRYDPEGDGTTIGSLGVFEHWDNAADRQYSRNLGTGDGVELLYVDTFDPVNVAGITGSLKSLKAYPNPFSETTVFEMPVGLSASAVLSIYSVDGRQVKQFAVNGAHEVLWDATSVNGKRVAAGVYLFHVKDATSNETFTGKVSVQ